MTHPLTPFAHRKRSAPYITDWLKKDVHVVSVGCKAELAVSRKGAIVHRIEAAAAMIGADRIRYAARWLCGTGSNDVVLLASADAHGGNVCKRCLTGVAGIFVYRCFAAGGRLLYIGCTGRYAARMAAHAAKARWWAEVADITREAYPSLTAARAAERLAIEAEKPEHNRQWVPA